MATTGGNWVLFRSATYLGGKGLTFGQALIPSAAVNKNTYSVVMDTIKSTGCSMIGEDFSVIADNSLDHVFIGKRLAAVDSPEKLIAQASRKLKIGGHLIIHTDIAKEAPGLIAFYPNIIADLVAGVGKWKTKAIYETNDESLQIYKKLVGKRGIEPIEPKPTKPTVCIARYGALGDAIIMTPLIGKLSDDGYHVTVNITPYCVDVFKNNPHIDNYIIQERDMIPNHQLSEYWGMWAKEYDRYINLSESIEGDLLKVEGRKEYFTTKSWRNETCKDNYYDYTLKRGGYSDVTGMNGELYFSKSELRDAKKFFDQYKDKFVILWALNGSSHHKVYPLMETVLKEVFKVYPNSICITVGDTLARLLEFDHPQLIPKAGVWSIRESLIATKFVNLVVGPETMITNASGCFETPKITLLSHSSHHNLCAHWLNDYSLEPDQTIAPCYPCNQLHYTLDCPIGKAIDTVTEQEMGESPICTLAITPKRLLDRIIEVYTKHYNG